jgi:hypothetical protein
MGEIAAKDRIKDTGGWKKELYCPIFFAVFRG